MDTIWVGNPLKLEVIGPFGGDEKTNDHTELTMLNAKKIVKNIYILWSTGVIYGSFSIVYDL